MNCVILGFAGAMGQIFIFLTVSLYDCYFLTIITTTRKFFSVVYSNYRFGHQFSQLQWAGAVLVMLSTTAEVFKVDKWFEPKVEESKKLR
jgi:UDP-galactose transporter B1